MIKEIMLASALSFSHPFVNLEDVAQPIEIYFHDITYPDLLINLDSGYISNGNIYYSTDDGYYVAENLNSYGRTNFYYFMDFIQSGISDMGFNYTSNFDGCSLHLIFDLTYLDVDYSIFGYEDCNEIYLSCRLLTNGEDDTTYVQIGEDFSWVFSNSFSYFDLPYLDSSILDDNIYLNIDLVSSTTNNDDSRIDFFDFNGFNGYLKYDNFYFEDEVGNANFDYLTFDDYIYNDFKRLIHDYEGLEYDYNMLMHESSQLVDSNEQLQSEKAELIEENDKLVSINLELRKENETLNSKHVLSNVFEIVRGAFDGIINFLEIELMPNLTLGTVIFIPVVIGVIFFILKALVL